MFYLNYHENKGLSYSLGRSKGLCYNAYLHKGFNLNTVTVSESKNIYNDMALVVDFMLISDTDIKCSTKLI